MASKRRQRSKLDILSPTVKLINLAKKGPYYSLAIIICLAAIFAQGVDAYVYKEKIYRGVQINNVDFSGLSKIQATAKLNNIYKKDYLKPVKITYQSKKWTYNPSEYGFKVNINKTVQKALDIAKTDSLAKNLWQRISTVFRPINIESINSIDEEKLEDFIASIKGLHDKPCTDAKLIIKEGKPTVVKGIKGYGLNKRKCYLSLIEKTLSIDKKELSATPEKLVPEITQAQAKKLIPEAKQMISDDLVYSYKNRKWKLDTDQLKYFFKTRKELKDDNYVLIAGFYKDELIPMIRSQVTDLIKRPVDARFEVINTKVNIIPSQDGLDLDDEATLISLEKTAKLKKNRRTQLVFKSILPQRSTQKAESMGIKERISTFTTYYPAGQSRVTNIHLLGDILNGKLVPPGDTFSFNGYVGQRTAERGFVKAPEIRNGTHVDAIGGGLCQVATTVYNAILEGGYDVTERQNHSLFVSRYPTGRDATVSWDEPDLKFINDTDYYILIQTAYDATSITISFYSTNIGRKVKFKTVFLGTIPYPVQGQKDPTLEVGQQKISKQGIAGKKYNVTRYIYDKSGKLLSSEVFESIYQPEAQIISLGSKPKPKAKEKDKKKAKSNKG
ncbi:MAG: hypothetical protein C4562_05790 [Actinobacteria bacterium]|nr:MAG: hypothetical protein C4562_05790 [Actinomycetota bacterium]